nr:hypothetical protein [Tanacetum cinerariifolium]
NPNPRHLLDYDKEEDPKMEIEEEELEEEPVEEPEPLPGHGDQFDAHPNPQPGNMNGWVDDYEEEEDEENKDAEEPDGVPEAVIGAGSQRPFAIRDFPIEVRMREIIRDQFATSMSEFMANMNSGAGGPGGASGSRGAGGSGGTGGNA